MRYKKKPWVSCCVIVPCPISVPDVVTRRDYAMHVCNLSYAWQPKHIHTYTCTPVLCRNQASENRISKAPAFCPIYGTVRGGA